jgi:hypothetical protein
MRHARAHVSAWTVLVVLVPLVAIAPSALAGGTSKPFAATVAPHAVPAGASASLTLTVSNDAHPQHLGSANLTLPPGFSYETTDAHPLLGGDPGSPLGDAAIVGAVIELRDLALPPGAFLTLSFVAQAPCLSGTYDWGIVAKQANGFHGVGNNFWLEPPPVTDLTTVVSGECHLHFLRQPADAQVDESITDAPLQIGSPIQVQVETEAGTAVTAFREPIQLSIATVPPGGTAVLHGTTTVDPVDGVATFCDPDQIPECELPSIPAHGLGYTLAAAAEDIAATTSVPFNVVDGGAVCEEPGRCQVHAQVHDTTGAVSVRAIPGDLVAVSIGVEHLTCAGYTNTSQVVTFASTAASVLTGTIRFDDASDTKRAEHYQVCFSSSLSFVDRFGNVVPPGGSGLLPNCTRTTGPPCIVCRKKDWGTDEVTLRFRAPAGDPKGVG